MTSTEEGRRTERLAADEASCRRAAEILARGGLVGFPTETVYGLGADSRSPSAVASLYEAKGRPRFNPLIAHVAALDEALERGRFDDAALRLAEAFWPGPLTIVVPLSEANDICDLARAGLSSVGIRIPSHPVARRILADCGFPVVAPSANRSGRISPTSAADVVGDLDSRIDAVVDGGPTQVGIESTIVACLGDGPRLLRPGGLPREAIEAVLGRPLGGALDRGGQPIAPGALASHYAPDTGVRLDAQIVEPGEAALLFGPFRPSGLDDAHAVLNLSEAGDLREAAANLFGYLRRLDASGARTIAVTPISGDGLAEGIRDRLQRAAADRS